MTTRSLELPFVDCVPPLDMQSSGEDIHAQYANDDLDDVFFASAPASPSHGPTATATAANAEYSDIPRLKAKHETEGYRDGITRGKADSVQKGFDEGYSLGAMLGLRIGRILGLLEAVWLGIDAENESKIDGMKEDRERMRKLWELAEVELSIRSIFAKEWWGGDGLWRFDVSEKKGADEMSIADVAREHPLVRKWDTIIDQEAERWGVDLEIVGDALEAETDRQATGPLAATGLVGEVSGTGQRVMGISKPDLNW